MLTTSAKELSEKGFVHQQNCLNRNFVTQLITALEDSFTAHRDIQLKNNVEINTRGIALHVVLNNNLFIDVLQTLVDLHIFSFLKEHYFKGHFILNSFGGNNNLPNTPHYATTIHRDIRFFSGDLPLMLNMIIMLDDFTPENGATFLLPYSHKIAEKPSEDYFYQNAIQITGKQGDIVFFNSNVWHAGSVNQTEHSRRALTLTFSKPFMKQQLDYCKALGYDRIEKLNHDVQQILGYHARVPTSLEEWYQPLEKRYYQKNQDETYEPQL